MELSGRGVKIRSRALMTTLWARLVLGDLFLHGIGGAKYDQVTDVIVERFFGLQPPGYMVLSATLHLPVDRPAASVPDEATVHRQLRELDFHPERFVSSESSAEVAALVAEKRRWVSAADDAGERAPAPPGDPSHERRVAAVGVGPSSGTARHCSRGAKQAAQIAEVLRGASMRSVCIRPKRCASSWSAASRLVIECSRASSVERPPWIR